MIGRINPTRRSCPTALPLCLRARPTRLETPVISGVSLQVGQIDEQIRLPLRRFGDGRHEVRSNAPLELKPAQHLRSFTPGKIIGLMNIGVADDQAKHLQGLPVTTRAYVRTTEQVFDGETAALPV